jgi:catechol 2,3-dioxygenase-like lactoylglutathione lyase family enzyme
MKIERIDHFVLTVKDINATCEFYSKVLGMKVVAFNQGRVALKFGNQKLNIHEFGKEIEPKAIAPTPGSADFCLITQDSLSSVIDHLRTCQVEIIEELVNKTGAMGKITSIYIRDPDQNLVEISSYENEGQNVF